MPTLLFENGPDRGSGVELESGKTYTVGRDPRADIVVRDDLVSRTHCRIKEFKGAWYIKDGDSTNGVWVNDVKIDQVELKFGDQVRLGDVLASFLEEGLEQVRREQTLGGYRLERRLGRGGMGTVFKALQISLGREVALKVLSPHLVRDPKFVDLFQREARAAGQLNHPHIVQVYDVGQEGDQYFYSMEYIEGGSLEDRLREESKIEPSEVIGILEQAALALEYAESRHIVHRDIKPDNLMITGDGRVKIADLGLALSVVENKGGQTGQPILGTPHFLSPEQALRREVDTRSDIYSLGATAYRMLTGHTLFEGSSAEEIIRKQVREEPRPVREVAPEVPEKLALVVHRMLEKDPDDRYESASELRDALHHLSRRRGRTVALWSAVGVAVIAIAFATYLFVRGPEKEIIIQKADPTDRAEVFKTLDELERAKLEIEALRGYNTLVEDALESFRKELAPAAEGSSTQEEQRALERWIEKYQGYPFPELDRARDRVTSIEKARAAAEERGRRILAARAEKRRLAEEGVAAGLESHDYLAAHRAAAGMDVEDPESAGREELEALRESLLRKVEDAATTQFETAKDEVLAHEDGGDLPAALERIAAALPVFPEVDDEASGDFADRLREYHGWFPERRESVLARQREVRETALREDLRRVVEAFGPALREDLLDLRLDAAAHSLETAAESTRHEGYRSMAAAPGLSLGRATKVLGATLDRLAAGGLPDVLLRGSEFEKGATIETYDPSARTIDTRLDIGAGSRRKTFPIATFAAPSVFLQLTAPFVQDAQERLAVLETCLLLETASWARALDPLRVAIERYDPEVGWRPVDLPETGSTESSLEDSLAEPLRALEAELPEQVSALRERIALERSCHDQLLEALGPFVESVPSIHWSQSRQRIDGLYQEHPGSVFLRMVYPLVHADYEYPLAQE